MDHPSKHELEARSESPLPALEEYDVLLLGSAEAGKYITLSGDEDLVFFPAAFGLWRLPYCVARLAAASTERRKRLPSQLRATETPFPQQTDSRQPEPGKPEP